MRKHPSEANLALFAGGELNRWTRWSVERHIAICDGCRRDISDFSALRADSAVLAELPEAAWGPMAAEMKANIRVGLEAGECVSPHAVSRMIFSPRALAACVSHWRRSWLPACSWSSRLRVERTSGDRKRCSKPAGPVSSFREGDQGMVLLNQHAHEVNDLATGRAMQQSYVDSETGMVTINNVYYVE